MFLMRLHVPFVIKAMGAYEMSLRLLKAFLQKMYATLNIALSMYSDFQKNS